MSAPTTATPHLTPPPAAAPSGAQPAVMIPRPMRVTRVARELPDTVTLHLDPAHAGGFRFAPGQFNMLYVHGAGEVPISISGDPARPQTLVHTVRAVGSVTRPLCATPRGGTLGVRGPFGAPWPVEEARGKDVLIVAGGLGLAPLRPAILHVLSHRAAYGKVAIVYGARTPEQLLFRKELESWRARLDCDVQVTVDQAASEWYGHVGVVPALIARAPVSRGNVLAMVCGPEIMMRFAVRELEELGVAAEAIWLSLERSMKCGVGLCGHCQLGPYFVCKDGPVMRLDRLTRLLYQREV